MAKLVDISLPLSAELLTWPGDPPIAVRPAKRQSRGDAANVSQLDFGNHSGTHVDPPNHFIEDGKAIDDLDPSIFVGPAWVAELPDAVSEISPSELEGAEVPRDVERLLIKTSNSGTLGPGSSFRRDFVALSVEAARWAVERGLRLVGVDYLSVERFDAPFEHPVHRTLLAAGVIIVEGLDLSDVPAGWCELLCLPLLIAGGDGAPARAMVRVDEP